MTKPKLALALLLPLTACGDGRSARDDSVAVARLVAEQAVPVVTPGVAAEVRLPVGAVAGTFDSTFRAALEPAVARLRGADSLPGVVVDVRVTTLQLAGDSAEVVVHRRGHYRTDTTRFSSSDTRYRLAWAREGGWSLTQTEPFNFQGEGTPSSRARDVWWPQQK